MGLNSKWPLASVVVVASVVVSVVVVADVVVSELTELSLAEVTALVPAVLTAHPAMEDVITAMLINDISSLFI
jgi:hypothetical protein